MLAYDVALKMAAQRFGIQLTCIHLAIFSMLAYDVALKMAAQRFGIQLPRARCIERLQKANDLTRDAVNCNAGLGA
jgi:hypothetical protein